jgi:D-erythronate 2-dehydrogenase
MAALTGRSVLVTGAFGNVGRYVLDRLSDEPRVVASDVPGGATRRAAERWLAAAPPGQERRVAWVDLRDAGAVQRLVADATPRAVVHLAGVIPPATYRDVALARAVNVDAVEHLADAVAGQGQPCRFVLASSMAAFGPRNPHTVPGVTTATTPTRPREVYGAHKVAAERILRERLDDAVVLRLAAVVFPDQGFGVDRDSMHLEALLPVDGRVHVVDGRDAATALVRTIDADCFGEVLLVGGDASCRLRQRDLARDMTGAVGLPGVLPAGLPGDPDDDDGWFCVDWMDTTRAQQLLDFQQHSWRDTLRDVSAGVGVKRHLLPAVVPVARSWLASTTPRRGRRGPYSRVWEEIAEQWGSQALCSPPPDGREGQE